MVQYTQAEICLNGHVIVSDLMHSGVSSSPFCGSCGAKTIRNMPLMWEPPSGANIMIPSILAFGIYSAPAYCIYCGEAIPLDGNCINYC